MTRISYVDLVCERSGFVEPARMLFAYGLMGKFSLTISALSFVNTVYIGRKYGYSAILEKLCQITEFVEVVDLKGKTVTWALDCDWKDYEDATQAKTAAIELADCIVTRNKKDFQKSLIPVYTVEELLSRIK